MTDGALTRPGLASRDFVLPLVAIFCVFFNYFGMAPVAAIVITQASGRPELAGTGATVFALLTIVFETLAPSLMKRFSNQQLSIAGLLLVALSDVPFLVAGNNVPALVGSQIFLGMGFGTSVVVGLATVVTLAPPERQGVATGYYGLASTAPGIIGAPIGLKIFELSGRDATFGLMMAIALFGAAAMLLLGRRVTSNVEQPSGFWSALRRKDILVVAVPYSLTAATFGMLLNFSALALPESGLGSAAYFFLLLGIGRCLARWLSGKLVDVIGPNPVLFGTLTLSVAALVVVAATLGGVLAVVSIGVFGLAFGMLQTAAFVGMVRTGDHSQFGAISAIWNFAFDFAYGIGSFLIGLVVGGYGFGVAFWVLPFLPLVGLTIVAAGRSRAADPSLATR
jgi:predicted MFS family arabinose efflux permease